MDCRQVTLALRICSLHFLYKWLQRSLFRSASWWQTITLFCSRLMNSDIQIRSKHLLCPFHDHSFVISIAAVHIFSHGLYRVHRALSSCSHIRIAIHSTNAHNTDKLFPSIQRGFSPQCQLSFFFSDTLLTFRLPNTINCLPIHQNVLEKKGGWGVTHKNQL